MRLVLIKRSFSAVIALLMVLNFSFVETACAQKDTALPRDVIVVCHEDLRNGLGPWVSHREKQGYRIQVLAPSNSAFDQYKAIIEAADKKQIAAVVLVGDAPSGKGKPPVGIEIPTAYISAKVNLLFGSEPEIATDNRLVDVDRDRLPDFPVGRIPVRTVDELKTVVSKIIRYENPTGSQSWQRDFHCIAGVGGFGALQDKMIESAARKLLGDGVPAHFRMTMTYASWRSPFCPDPNRFGEVTLDRLNAGSLYWVYMGHGLRTELDRVLIPNQPPQSIMTRSSVKNVNCVNGMPVAVFLACYVGAYDSIAPSMSEQLLLHAKGPIAVIAGSRVTMPYAMSVMGEAMLEEAFRGDHETLGSVFHKSKHRLGNPEEKASRNRLLLDGLAAVVSPRPDLMNEERLEHVDLFNLIGDPLLRVRKPERVKVDVDRAAAAGSSHTVTINSPISGEAVVELATMRGQLRFPSPVRSEFENNQKWLDGLDKVYNKSNNDVWASVACDVKAGESTTVKLEIPKDSTGICFVRVMVDGENRLSLGSESVIISKPKEDSK